MGTTVLGTHVPHRHCVSVRVRVSAANARINCHNYNKYPYIKQNTSARVSRAAKLNY